MIKFLKFVPVQLTFFLIIGVLIGNYFTFQPIELAQLSGALVVVFIAVYVYSNKKLKPVFLYVFIAFVIVFIIGISSITYKKSINKYQHYSYTSKFQPKTELLVTILVQKVLKPSSFYNKYEASIVMIEGEKSIGKILVNFQKDSLKKLLKVDDLLNVNTSILDINEPLNPYAFNYKEYLQNQQILHQIYVKSNQVLKLPSTTYSLKGIAAKFREKINVSLINYGFKDNELAVVNALLLGQRQTISSDLIEDYSDAGAIHILAVSGLHVGIILLILTFLFKPLHRFKKGKLIASILIICLLWMYAIIAGLSASVVRAVTMFTAIAVGMHLNKPSNTYNTLVISMFFLLLFNPFYLFEVGFQLSYLAVFSIVWIQPKIYNLWVSKFWFLRKFWQLFTVSIAAQIGVLPLSIFYFHQFPGLFFISNLVIIPFLGFILIFGIVTISLSLIDFLPQFLADLFKYIIQLMNNFVEWIANKHYFVIKDLSLSYILMLGFYILILVLIKWTEKKNYKRLVFVLVAFIGIQSIVIFEKRNRENTNEFIVFNENRTAVLATRYGSDLFVYSKQDSLNNLYSIQSYLLGTGLKNKFNYKDMNNIFKFNNETILIIDSLGFYNYKSIQPTIIVLQNSPKLNLERLLELLQPKLVVADASNYKSYINNWESTCIKNKTPFHNTLQKGAFIIKE